MQSASAPASAAAAAIRVKLVTLGDNLAITGSLHTDFYAADYLSHGLFGSRQGYAELIHYIGTGEIKFQENPQLTGSLPLPAR